MARPESILESGQLAATGKPLDSGDARAVRLNRERRAGLHAHPIQKNRARPALARVTPDLGPSEARIAKEVHQEKTWFNFLVVRPAVDTDGDGTLHRPSDAVLKSVHRGLLNGRWARGHHSASRGGVPAR